MDHYLVFVRHAHRDTSARSEDNGIDDKGRNQVMELLEKYKAEKLPQAEEFWSSPKLRCQQTLEPLALAANSTLKVVNELDEQKNTESGKDFRLRVINFIEKLKSESKTIYLCSHGDWLPEAIQELTGDWVDVRKGEAIVCQQKSKSPNAKWKIK